MPKAWHGTQAPTGEDTIATLQRPSRRYLSTAAAVIAWPGLATHEPGRLELGDAAECRDRGPLAGPHAGMRGIHAAPEAAARASRASSN